MKLATETVFLKFPHPLLEELYIKAQKEKFPVIEPEIGALLHLITRSMKPEIIFEFGSGFGYSALWMALACSEDCKIYCTDYQEKNYRRAIELFKRFGVEKRITYFVGEAETLFNQLSFKNESIDLVVFDHEKQNYSESLDLVLPSLKKRGLIIADDVFLDRKLNPDSLKAKAIRFFREEILKREDLYTLILPIGDGLAIIQKV